jgi:hypothetical protein
MQCLNSFLSAQSVHSTKSVAIKQKNRYTHIASSKSVFHTHKSVQLREQKLITHRRSATPKSIVSGKVNFAFTPIPVQQI